jgi:glycosyltransferase involved in cell wall biosynthesis
MWRNWNTMRIVWLTGRRLTTDLASSTEIGLFNSLEFRGHDIEIHYPGDSDKIAFEGVRIHPSLLNSGLRGFKSKLASKSAIKIIRDVSKDDAPNLFVDWRLVPWMGMVLSKYPANWFIIDRGPPADDGILGKLQWRYWMKSWRIAGNSASGGVVVSEEHEKIVRPYSGQEIPICSLSGGVKKSNITSQPRIRPDETLNLVYIGRIDGNRGVRNLVTILDWAEKREIALKMHIAGEGDESEYLRTDSRIIHHGILDSQEIHLLLSQCDIGLLPMPPGPVWVTSSPLKLAEYAAAGLAVVGVDHPGHDLPGSREWIDLGPVDDWWSKGIKRFSELSPEGWNSVHQSATNAAMDLTFDRLAERLEEFMQSVR